MEARTREQRSPKKVDTHRGGAALAAVDHRAIDAQKASVDGGPFCEQHSQRAYGTHGRYTVLAAVDQRPVDAQTPCVDGGPSKEEAASAADCAQGGQVFGRCVKVQRRSRRGRRVRETAPRHHFRLPTRATL